jgi:prepilin-type N-terminal cleavage/methylation domain-containing protein
MKALQKGYTLMELMVVVAIVGIISAIALPQYESYTCDTYQGQAIADVRICALALDRYYSDGFTYVNAVIDNDLQNSVCNAQSPAEGPAKFIITLPAATVNDYTIQSAPVDADGCGVTVQLSADGELKTI